VLKFKRKFRLLKVNIKEKAEALVMVSKEMLIRLITWSYLQIRMLDEVTILRLIIVPLKGWKSSNIW
jgi:hypothetical protein